MTKAEKLLKICKKFRDDHDISCPETIYLCDNVIEDASEFIEQIMEIIGYVKSEE